MSNTIKHLSIELPTEHNVTQIPKQRSKWLSIIYNFSSETTAHGLPRIVHSENRFNRLYWSIATLACAALMIYFIIRAILEYFTYPTQIDISIESEWPQHFPAFSFCNVGGFRLDAFAVPFANYTNSHNLTNTNDSSTVYLEQIPYLISFMRDLFSQNLTLEPFAFPLSATLVSCSYNSHQCTTADFVPFIHTTYGYCYTFNGKLKNESEGSVRDGTEYNGLGILNLGLYVHSNQYIPYMTDSVGIVAVIHDNTQVPLMDTAGYNLNPGQKHKLSYRKKNYDFLPAPYTLCESKTAPWMQTMFESYEKFDYKYSKPLCIKLDAQIFTYEKCGCVNPYYWDIRSVLSPKTNTVISAPLCNVTNNCYTEAASAYINSTKSINKNDEASCLQECEMNDFIIKKSSLATPTLWQLNDIKSFVENSSIPQPSDWSTSWPDYILQNYLAVSVVRETDVVEKNIQSASLSIGDVISNIGGQTGLWIGISILSVMELFEMIYRLLRLIKRRNK
ncbi:unnamed protein product [Adineta ricciae]|uniref:Uncharacterized protein n=2 Tax=Adineta ricciae TaxID=249248 RepID=A0A815D1W2_ADIRI|nr:unnamed protein product [Adineta ricciae]